MARYLTEAAAAEDGYEIVHDEANSRFVITREGEEFGEAHYSLLGEEAINFDHTVVHPQLRGTGLSGLLAHRAVTDAVTEGRRKVASCSFIAGYLQKYPELAGN